MKDSPMKDAYYRMRRKQALRFNHHRGEGDHQHRQNSGPARKT